MCIRDSNDPDVTKNVEIFAELILTSTPGVNIKGGTGIGVVTKPGLQVPVGDAAINPTPMEMIISNLSLIHIYIQQITFVKNYIIRFKLIFIHQSICGCSYNSV